MNWLLTFGMEYNCVLCPVSDMNRNIEQVHKTYLLVLINLYSFLNKIRQLAV